MSPALIQFIIQAIEEAIQAAPEIIKVVEEIIAAAKGKQPPVPPAQ